jgi:hypothetical protein
VTEWAGKRKQQRETEPEILCAGIGLNDGRNFGDFNHCHCACDYFSSGWT